MKCSKCGKEINEQAKFCKYCGTPVQVEKQVSSANASKEIQRRNSKTWIIIASILLGILVLTGVTVLTVKMTGEKDKATQKVEKPKQEDPVKPEESTEEVKAETPEQAFENYLVFLVDAVNNGDYTDAEKVMVKDSPLYQDQKKLVEKLYADGTKEKLTKQGIKSQEDIDDTHVRLISDEEYEITYAGVDWKSAYKEYIMTLDDADTLSGYNLIDVNQDNLPELFIRYPMTYGEVMIYVNKEGNAQLHRKGGVNGYTANTGMVWSVTGHGSIEENFCQYNKDSGQFETVHLGRYEVSEEDIYEFDGKKCRDQEEYDKLVKDIFDKKNYMKIEFQLFSSDNHIQELLEFVENY